MSGICGTLYRSRANNRDGKTQHSLALAMIRIRHIASLCVTAVQITVIQEELFLRHQKFSATELRCEATAMGIYR